jgi:tRNA(adenine34) deaminase
MQHQKYMTALLSVAQEAEAKGEVPVAAMIVNGAGEILNVAYNLVETNQNPLHHAECIAITQTIIQRQEKYLDDCTLYVTLEPCAMCAGAIAQSRLKRVVFGAYDPKMGQVDHNARVLEHTLQKIEIIGGVMETEMQSLLTEFFKKLR